jgi:hypothetical protein
MNTVFFSYQREDLLVAQRLVRGLRSSGLKVWWDQDLALDAPWEATIERELEAAKVAIVAWSKAAVASESVKAEARRARTADKLIQVFIEDCEPPLFFGERQGIDLSDWTGAADDPRFQTVLDAARAIIAGKRPPAGVGYAPRRRRPWPFVFGAAALVSAIVGFIANVGGARDALCSVSALNAWCGDERRELLQSLTGTWGRQDRDCSETVTYSLARSDDGIDRILGRAPNFESLMQVIAAEDGVVVARSTTPTRNGSREQWEFRPDGDRLVIYDKDGIATTLMRCDR